MKEEIKTIVNFYQPNEKFKSVNEHICVSRIKDNDVQMLAVMGPNDLSNYDSFIETGAQSVLFALSFEMYKGLNDSNIEKDKLARKIEVLKDSLTYDYVKRLNCDNVENKMLVEIGIFKKLNEYGDMSWKNNI